ncbi:MAG: VOC family protein [Streptosporangiales bacterium]
MGGRQGGLTSRGGTTRVALGAKRVEWDYPDDADFVVLADTEGNLFCVVNAGA